MMIGLDIAFCKHRRDVMLGKHEIFPIPISILAPEAIFDAFSRNFKSFDGITVRYGMVISQSKQF